MAKESKERKLIKSTLLKKGDSVSFALKHYVKIARLLTNLNQQARVERLIKPNEVLYSVKKEDRLYVIRNY